MKISIIIPAYNEEQSIKDVIFELDNFLKENNIETEIIVVNDGSTDQTKNILENIKDIKLINHPYNKGYGASLKTGVKNAQYNWILFYDSDGQHNPEYIKELIKYSNDYDMIVGNREGYKGPFIRQPGKKLLSWTANYLVQKKIPDLNSGFRLVKKDLFSKFSHIFPNGFSLTTTITLAFFKEGFNVKYVSIKINKRNGKSHVKVNDGFKTIMLIFRTIILFSPLKVFLPASYLILLLSFTSLSLDIIHTYSFNIGDTTILFFISSILIFFFGLLADQISAIRREIKMK